VDTISSPTHGPTVGWLVIISHAKLSVLENVKPINIAMSVMLVDLRTGFVREALFPASR
jgi:hypothetical protein